MKSIIITGSLFLAFNFSFSQIPFGGIEGLKDTSNFRELRSQRKIQALAIEFDSTYVPAYFKRAVNKPDEAIADYNTALEIFPTFSLSYDFYISQQGL